MMRVRLGWVAAVLLGACGPALGAQKAVVFEHVRVFDGERVSEDQTVVVAGGKVQALGSGVEVPAGAEHVNGMGKTLLPGLIDAHVHIHGPLNLSEALMMGVTTELDMMSSPELDAWLHAHENGEWADFRAAGILATVPGGHGTEYGVAIPTIDKPQDAEKWVDARIAEGSDYIKLVHGDSSIFGGRMSTPTLNNATMAAVIAAAHARGKLTVVHIDTEQDARDALDAGADGLAHLFFGGGPKKNFAATVAAHHAFVVPTLSVLSGTCEMEPMGASLAKDPDLKPYMTAGQAERLQVGHRLLNLQRYGPRAMAPSCDGARRAVMQLRAAGVPVLVGTDAPNPGAAHGVSVHAEMAELVRLGMSPTEVLAAATSQTAKAFHLTDRGSIAPGMRADLLLVDGDPSREIRDTRKIAGVWKAGLAVKRGRPEGRGDDGR